MIGSSQAGSSERGPTPAREWVWTSSGKRAVGGWGNSKVVIKNRDPKFQAAATSRMRLALMRRGRSGYALLILNNVEGFGATSDGIIFVALQLQV